MRETPESPQEVPTTDAERRFRCAFDYAPIGMALVAPDGGWLDVNPALTRILGYSPAEFLAMSHREPSHPDDIEQTLDLGARLLSGDMESFDIEKRYIHRSGHAVWVNLSATLVRDGVGRAEYFIAQIQDISDRRRSHEQLQYLVEHDSLTGCLNRRGLELEMERHLQAIKRFGSDGALVVLDLDRFKYVNDSLGHHAGDRLITRVAGVLKAELREIDVLARLGGDEFAVLLSRGTDVQACTTAERLIQAIRRQIPAEETGGLQITVSAGVAMFGTGESDAEQVLIDADLAMYDAKEGGRNRIVLATPSVRGSSRMKSRVDWMERIHRALSDDGFELHAQPILGLDSGGVELYELLIRMRDGTGDLIPPMSFLDVAERFDLIQEIDRWVVRQAFAIAADEQSSGGSAAFSINLSGKSIGDPLLLEVIEAELRRTGVEPWRLVFEITETAAVTDMPSAQRLAGRLRDLGCRVALDDFGSGFGTFSYLKQLPFDIIKIDGEFVKGCVGSHADQVIIDGVVRIAAGLGKQTIAEFTEDAVTLELLRSRGVDFAQGYHIGRPEPVTGAAERAERARPVHSR